MTDRIMAIICIALIITIICINIWAYFDPIISTAEIPNVIGG